MSTLLLCNITDAEKKTAIRLSSLRLGLKCMEVRQDMQECVIEDLLSGNTPSVPSSNPFQDEMLIMHGLSGEELNTLLQTLRTTGNTVRLKAVVTDTNKKWTVKRLHKELLAEEQAIQKWKQSAHRPKGK